MSIEEVFSEKVEKVENKKTEKSSYSLETLTLLVNKERVDHLENKLKTNFKDLRKRHEEIKALQSLIRALNAATDENEKLDLTNKPELKELYQQVGEKFDLSLPKKDKFTGFERERMIENIKMAVNEANLDNDLLMNLVQQLNSERNESFQLALKILKTLNDIKTRQTQAIAGR